MTKQSNKRKFLATTLTATMVAAAVAPVAGAAAADTTTFPDVPADHPYADVIADMAAAGIVKGDPNGNFNLGGKITRAEAAQMVAGLLDLKTGANKNETKFEDVKSDVWYTGAINSLVAEGIIAGISEKVFEPGANITRGQLAQLLVVAYGLEDVDVTDVKLPFTDVDEDAWYTKPIKQLYSEGLITGQTANTFGPKADMKRGDFAWLAANVDYAKGDKLPKPTPEVTEGITSVKAVNDTRVLVEFGSALDKDFIREAELNGKYFTIHTEGNSVQSEGTIQSKAINFAPDGKSATFDLEDNKEIESGKKYIVSLLDGANPKVSDVVYAYAPTVLKAAADAPNFEVSTVADKIFVKYNTKMKDTAKDVENYEVYDEGSQKLGDLSEFLTEDAKGEWVDLNEKKEVEFQLGKDSDKKLQAGKTYKLVVKESVKTDDNKTLSESNRTIKVKTPSVKEASPVAKVARVTSADTITLYFDQDIASPNATNEVNLNKAQLNLKTSTGKTVDVEKFAGAEVVGDNALAISFTEPVFDAGLTYKVDMPANVVQNGIFTNAMNEATTSLTAKAQENVSIKTMKAEIVADPKNDAKADLILTFDQVPNLDTLDKNDIVLYDGRDKYVLDSDATVKVFGGDTSGKSIIIEDTKNFFLNGTNSEGNELQIKTGESYDVEIAKDALETDTFDTVVPAKNKSKLTASTKGISISAPIIDEVVLQSADKIEVVFEENIKGNVKASDITVDAFVANRSDIFEANDAAELEANPVSGAGYFDVSISGKVMTLTAKTGVKFPTSEEATNIKIAEKVFTNSTGKVGNEELEIEAASHDFVDNAAPVVISAHADEDAKQVTVTYSENVKLQGDAENIATLFFTDKGENASEGVEYVGTNNTATITFKEDVWKNDTDLSAVTLKYSQGSSYYIQDLVSNKMKTSTLKGFFSIHKNGPTN